MSGAAAEARGWSRRQMAGRLAAEFGDGWVVNLGAGIPALCAGADLGDRSVVFHSENGVIGHGPAPPEGREDPHLVDAGGRPVSLRPGAAVVHHADGFALIRSGRIDAAVMGSYECAANGDFANWKTAANAGGGGIGGAMDLAAGARRVFLVLEHTTHRGAPRLVLRCALPVTARRVVTLAATNYGLFRPEGEDFRVLELAPGIALDEARAATGAPLTT